MWYMGTCPRHYATMMLIDKNIYTINCVEYCLLVGTIRSANSGESMIHYTAHPNTSNRCVQGHGGPGTSPTQYVPTCTTPPFYCILLCSSLWPLNLYALWYVVFFNTLVWICAVV